MVIVRYAGLMRVYNADQFSERDLRRFWSYVSLPDANGCMNWTGGRFKGRGGRLRYGCFGMPKACGGPAGAHRVSYVLANGSIPGDLTVDHICENLACVAPGHLRLLTQVQNALRGMTADESGERCAKGHNDWSIRSRQRVCRECYREYVKIWKAKRKQRG